jgi:hypothetical protein
MKNTIYIFLVFVLVFFLNLLLYIYVDGYREIIKAIKYGSNTVELTWWENDDSYNVNSIEAEKRRMQDDLEKGLLLDLDINENTTAWVVQKNVPAESSSTITSSWNTLWTPSSANWTPSIGRIAQLTVVEKDILDMFFENDYWLYKIIEKDDLLDIAWEYPDEYLQYGRDWLDVYMLTTREFEEVSSIFSVLEYEMPFSIKSVNNFWTQSFFINLERDDDKIRFIFEYREKVFGIKVQTTSYQRVKWILEKL